MIRSLFIILFLLIIVLAELYAIKIVFTASLHTCFPPEASVIYKLLCFAGLLLSTIPIAFVSILTPLFLFVLPWFFPLLGFCFLLFLSFKLKRKPDVYEKGIFIFCLVLGLFFYVCVYGFTSPMIVIERILY